MKHFKLIVTHPGDAHRDEMMAVGILAHAGKIGPLTELVRRDPTEEELLDPEVACVDIGNAYDPVLGNFDHHQMDRDLVECAMSLVAHNFVVPGQDMTYQELLGDKPWYKFTCWVDSQGPFATAKEFGLTELPVALRSPFEQALLLELENENWDVVVGSAKATVDLKVQQALDLLKKMEWMESNALAVEVGEVRCLLLPTDDAFGSERFRAKQKLVGIEYHVCLSHDNRGEGWSLYRFDDCPLVNFSKVEGDSRVSFAHKGGFIAKTSERLPLNELVELVSAATYGAR